MALGSKKSSTVVGVSDSIFEHNVHHVVSLSDFFRYAGQKSVREVPILEEPREIPSSP